MQQEFFKGKTVVVTGGSGFVGTHYVQALLKKGAKVRVPVHVRAMIERSSDVELVQCDLNDQEACRSVLRGADAVIHAAGAVSAAGVTSGTNAMSPITANLVLTANVMEACWAESVERVLIFGSSTGYPVTDHPVKETEMWSGPTADVYFGYGWMRRYLERLSEFVAQRSDTGVAICRPTATYGPYDDFEPKTSHVIPARIREAVEKTNPYVVWGDGTEARDFLYITDLVRGSLLQLEKKADGDPVNIGYGESITMKEIVGCILRESGHADCEVLYDITKPATIKRRLVDTSKAEELLGFKPEVSIEEGIRRTVQWYLQTLK